METVVILMKVLGTAVFFNLVIYAATSIMKDYYQTELSDFLEKVHDASAAGVKWTIQTAILRTIVTLIVAVVMLIWS